MGATSLLLALSGTALGQAASTPPGKGEQSKLGPVTSAAGSGGGASPVESTTTSSSLVRTIVGLLIVIAVIYGVTWVLKQVKSSREDDASGEGLSTAATLPLGPGRSVHLVRAGTEYLLLGVSDGGVQPLRTYTEQEARDAGLPTGEAVDELVYPKERAAKGTMSLVERIRDLTVRR